MSSSLQPELSACETAAAGAPDMIQAPSSVPFWSMSAAGPKAISSVRMSSGNFMPTVVKWLAHSL